MYPAARSQIKPLQSYISSAFLKYARSLSQLRLLEQTRNIAVVFMACRRSLPRRFDRGQLPRWNSLDSITPVPIFCLFQPGGPDARNIVVFFTVCRCSLSRRLDRGQLPRWQPLDPITLELCFALFRPGGPRGQPGRALFLNAVTWSNFLIFTHTL